ncbi:MAG: L-threonylcarbamoyladenylate synthase [Myxococcota bacterium]
MASGQAIHDLIEMAVSRLSADGLIGYPTETVWGLGACADREIAVERLFAWKGRRTNQPVAVLVSSPEAALRIGCRLDPPVLRLIEAFWPGPLMIVVPCEGQFARGVARDDGALGLRCSTHPLAHRLTEAVDAAGLGPLVSTSLNRTGESPAVDLGAAQAVVTAGVEDGLESPLLISSPMSSGLAEAGVGRPSSVVDCTGPLPKVLRVGAIETALIEKAWAQ